VQLGESVRVRGVELLRERRQLHRLGDQLDLGCRTHAQPGLLDLDGVLHVVAHRVGQLLHVVERGELDPQRGPRVLSLGAQHAGRVVSQLELTEQLYSQDFERDSNAIEVMVGRVRRKLGNKLIETRRGFGYLIEKPET